MTAKFNLDLETLLTEAERYDNPVTEKQKDILRAAETLFADRGFDGTPTAEIAREAGVTEKTLFKHFPTKLDLFRRILFPVLVRTLLPAQISQVRKVIQAPHATYRDAVRALAFDRLAVFRLAGSRARLVIGEFLRNDGFRDRFGAIWKAHVWDQLVATVAHFQGRGQIRGDLEPATVARMQVMLIGAYVFSQTLVARPRPAAETEAELGTIIEIFTAGLRPAPTGDSP